MNELRVSDETLIATNFDPEHVEYPGATASLVNRVSSHRQIKLSIT